MGQPPTQVERTAMKLAWAETNGLKEYTGNAFSGLRFLNHAMPKHFDYTRFPAQDHTTYWKKDGKPYCVISQPYHVSEEEMESVAALAKAWGFSVVISAAPAWHYPGGVVHMEWKSKDDVG